MKGPIQNSGDKIIVIFIIVHEQIKGFELNGVHTHMYTYMHAHTTHACIGIYIYIHIHVRGHTCRDI